MTGKIKSIAAQYAMITLACALYAVGFNWCFDPNHLSVGGFTGVAQIINFFIPQIPIGVAIIVLNLPLFLLSWTKVGRHWLYATLYATLVSSGMIDLLAGVYTFRPMEPMLAAVYGGVIVGLGCGLMLRYSGYLAAAPCADLPDYRGTVADLFEVVRTQKIEMLVLAQDVQDAEEVRRIMLLADNFHLRVAAVPVYNDFVTARSELDSIGGMRYMDLRLMNTCDIMGVNIVVTDMDKTLRLIEEKLEDWRGKYICVANVHTTVTAHEDPDYQKVQNGAVMALPDGGPLSKYSRQQGYVDAARVTGPDLMKELLKESKTKHYRHYFYGSTQKTLDVLREKVTENYPGAVIAGMYSPPFRPLTPEEDEDVVRMINEAKPDFVWVGLGAPKQERWMAVHEDRVQALMVGVGAAFDYEAGNIRRAPQWMQKHNLEWLYRLMQDPKRLFKRYFVTNTKYLWWTWRQ